MTKRSRCILSWLCASIALFVVLAGVDLRAQTSLATLVGTVTDPSGQVVPEATVTVVNTGTSIRRVTTSNGGGEYSVTALQQGTYDVNIEAPQFRTHVSKGIVLHVEQTARLDVRLQLGDVADKVTVTSEASLLTTDTAEVAQVVSNRSVTELPLNGRDFTQLVQLVPGANGGPPGTASGAPSMNGSNPESTGYLLDGQEDTELFQHHASIKPSIDVIEEFKVQDKLMSAEFGTASGGVISAVTKSGTNSFHGGAWDFLRNDALDARSFFDTRKPFLRRNQYGGYIGGPLWIPKVYNGRNRTFFMFDYEGSKIRTQTTVYSTVPTDAMKAGDFSGVVPMGQLYNPYNVGLGGLREAFPGNQIPKNMQNATALKILGLYREPNSPSTASDGRVANNYVAQYSIPQNIVQYLGRLDQNFGDNDRLFFRYSLSDSDTSTPGLVSSYGDALLGVYGRNGALNYTHTFSPATLNEFKFAVVQWNSVNGPASSFSDFNQTFGFDSTQPGVPPISITGFRAFQATAPGGGSTTYQRTYPYASFDLNDTLSHTIGAHSLKFGFSEERVDMNTSFFNVGGGARTFTGDYTRQIGDPSNSLEGRGFADFMLGIAENIGGLNLNSGAGHFRPRFAFYHAFVQDDWKVSRRLTVNIGVRYDLYQPPVTENGLAAAYFDFSTGTLVYPKNAPLPADCCAWKTAKSDTNQLYQGSKNNFAPRFGFAYRLGNDNRTVIRGGYGIFFDPSLLNVAYNNSQSPPFYANTTVTASPDETNPANFLPIGLDVAPINQPLALPVGFKSYAQKEKTGMMQQRTISIEHQLTSTLLAGVTYVGWMADHFMVDNPMNFPPPGPGDPQARRPYPQFASSIVQLDDSSSNYNGMTAKLEQRLWHGLSYLAAFTWGHGLGNGDTENGDNWDNWNQRYDNLTVEYGNNNMDIRRMFVMSGVYDIPYASSWAAPIRAVLGHWELGAIYTARTGLPITVFNSADTTNRGDRSSTYASTYGGPTDLPSDQRSPQLWFNTANFYSPAPYTYGNAGRNILRIPGVNNVDLSVMRNFPIREAMKLQFRGEFFNAFNRAQFSAPDNGLGDASFGQISSTVNTGRQIQLALKLLF